MSSTFEYKGYIGSAEVDSEDHILVGRLLFIRDVIGYSAESVRDLEAAFRQAVDEYLEACREAGDQPDTPCKGTFNVRVGPDLHRDVALAAKKAAVSLNDFVCEALRYRLDVVSGRAASNVSHNHYHVTVSPSQGTPDDLAGQLPGQMKWVSLSGNTKVN